jgi:hypothetical protein
MFRLVRPTLFTLFVFVFSLNTIADNGLVEVVGQALKQVNEPFKYTCGVSAQEVVDCPYMVEQFDQDTSTGLFFQMISDSPWNSCKKYLNSTESISTAELEGQLSSQQGRDLGLRGNYFNQQISKCLNTNNKSSKEVDIQKKAIISMSYNYLNKIKNNTHDLSKEMANINSILGNEITKDIPCDSFNMPHDSSYCMSLKANNCSPKGGVARLAGDIHQNALEPIYALALKIKEVRRKHYGRGQSILRSKKIKKLKAMIEFIKAENPILLGNVTEDFIDDIVDDAKIPSMNEVNSVLKKQFVENKKILKEKLDRNIKMNNCILYGDSSECGDFDDDFREIPYQPTPMMFSKEAMSTSESVDKQRAREELYQLPECIDRGRNLKNEFNSFALDFSLNVGLTVLTGGASLAIRAGQLGKMAMAARATTLGADAAFLGKGVNDAIDICNEELNGLSEISNESNSNMCPTSLDNPGYNRTSNMRGCVTAALLSSVDALPFVPAIASRSAKNRADRIRLTNNDVDNLADDLGKSGCFKYSVFKNKCDKFISQNKERLTQMHDYCLRGGRGNNNGSACKKVEKFLNDNEVLRLSNLIPPSKQGKSVVVEFNSGRGHITLRYFKEVVDENGEKVMKAFSYDGTSWMLPRRVNESMFTRGKNVDGLDSLDTYVPGSHYVIDISPSQVEKIHAVAKGGGFSKACTHDARKALHEAGVLSMPKGIKGTFDKITIKKLAKDLTDKYGKPKQSTIKSLEDALDPKKAGFSDEQWKTFTVTELGWAVLTPATVGVVYPTAVASTAALSITVIDSDGQLFQLSREKYRELVEELKSAS